ncbi:MAG: hypothetical protein AB7O96_13755 [Pseudobdellovibrionaceae bacterium]
MFLTALKTSKNLFLIICSLLFLGGCTLFDPPVTNDRPRSPEKKVIFAPYDQVWRAGQLAMGKYPLVANSMDTGLVETEMIRGPEGFKAPLLAKPPSSGVKYKIILRMVKGVVNGKEAVRVNVSKKIEISRDFFSTPERLVSDGLEEKVILYRMERELNIESALRKAAAQQNDG